MSRIVDLPIYAQRSDEITSKLYNLWRRIKIHFTLPMRIELTKHKGLIILLEHKAWVCADESQNDLPVIAWVDFDDHGRDALHTPVPCKLNYYHYAASKLRVPVLDQLETTFVTLLKNGHKK